MADRVLAHDKITVLWHSEVVEFAGTAARGAEGEEGYEFPRLRQVRVRTSDPAAGGGAARESTLDVAACFVAIGHSPNTGLFKDQLAMGPDGYLEATRHHRAPVRPAYPLHFPPLEPLRL